jgi:enoyl-[acyl-carrier-protein] reductase (NADH)
MKLRYSTCKVAAGTVFSFLLMGLPGLANAQDTQYQYLSGTDKDHTANWEAARRMYSKGLANQVGPQGIRVAAIAPGFIETDGAKGLISRVSEKTNIDENEARKNIIESIGGIPLERPGLPEEVRELVTFLASDRASYLHGTEFTIDGGSAPTI